MEVTVRRTTVIVATLAFVSLVGFQASAALGPFGMQADGVPNGKAAQYLYVYNSGVPGEVTGEYARYSIPAFQLQETTVADGVGSPVAFGHGGEPVFLDEGTSAFGVFAIPSGSGPQPGNELFSGVPCYASSFATAPNGHFFAVQYCSGTVLEYTPKSQKGGGAKAPIASYTGGNYGGMSQVGPTYAVVDKKGGLYVGDTGGGVTYFAKGSTSPSIAFPTGSGGYVNQMVVDDKGDVWSVHGPDATNVYFHDETSCVIDPSGTVVRHELAERFSNGVLVQQFYTSTSDSPTFATDGLSIAVDSKLRMYAGVAGPSYTVVLDYDPGKSCPDDTLAILGVHNANPQVAVDEKKNLYVTDYVDNTISAFKGGTTTMIDQIAQQSGLINLLYAAVH
jgi:hypothetical protein